MPTPKIVLMEDGDLASTADDDRPPHP